MEEEEKKKNPNWGGARKGAGRKRKSDEGDHHVHFRCSQDVYDILSFQKDKTAYIEAAIREKNRRDQFR